MPNHTIEQSTTYYDDLSVAFPGFSSLYWDDEDTVSFNVDIDGSTVGVTGVFNNGVWSFAPDDPAAVPAGVTIAYDTSGPDLIVNLDNATGSAITAEVSGFSSTTTAFADKWEMTIYHQPDATAWSGFPYSDGPLKTISLEFDKTTGSLAASSPLSMQLDLAGINGGMVEIDVSDMSQLAADFTILDVDVNGSGPATVSDYSISVDGVLYAQYENGQMIPLYKLALATVQSPDQMSVLPGNVFQPGINSGSVQIGFAGEGGLGDIISGALENSNVDIAEELALFVRFRMKQARGVDGGRIEARTGHRRGNPTWYAQQDGVDAVLSCRLARGRNRGPDRQGCDRQRGQGA